MKKSNILLNELAVICLLTIMTLLVSLSACSDDDGPTPPTPPIDPDSAMIQDLKWESKPKGLIGGADHIYCINMYIKDKAGNDLLDPENPNNVRDNKFRLEFEDQVVNVGDPVTYFGKITIDFGFDEIFYGTGNPIYLGILSPFWAPKTDVKFKFIWPERNIETKIRVYSEYYETNDSIYYRYGIYFDDGKGSRTIVVDN